MKVLIDIYRYDSTCGEINIIKVVKCSRPDPKYSSYIHFFIQKKMIEFMLEKRIFFFNFFIGDFFRKKCKFERRK